jgi:pyruvate carboxylase subunit B
MDDTLRRFNLDGIEYETRLTPTFIRRRRYQADAAGHVLARIPGIIQRVSVAPGEKVRRGQALVVLEAMKMQNDVASPCAGVIRRVHVKVGEMVSKGQLLVELA